MIASPMRTEGDDRSTKGRLRPRAAFDANDDSLDLAHRRIIARMKLFFACLSLLGGLVLVWGTDSNAAAYFAIFFTIVGYLFVDRWQITALPTPAAYALMLVVGLFCVSNFFPLDKPGNHQMVAVANLLALVQSVMMLQHKNRRIFEQLATFCLLELVVAASFNNALSYGLILIPMAIVAVLALAMLAATHVTESSVVVIPGRDLDASDLQQIDFDDPRRRQIEADQSLASILGLRSQNEAGIDWQAPQSIREVARRTPRMLRNTTAVMVPAVLLLMIVFFYALPRTTNAAVGNGQNAAVGFNDSVRLEQIGKMNVNPAIALRIEMRDQQTGEPYRIREPMYLRGKVLDEYNTTEIANRRVSAWNAYAPETTEIRKRLPRPYPIDASRQPDLKFDPVAVRITGETSRSDALFSLAPYYDADDRFDVDLRHLISKNVLRRADTGKFSYPRSRHRMLTHGFHRGINNPWLSLNAGLPDAHVYFPYDSPQTESVEVNEFGDDVPREGDAAASEPAGSEPDGSDDEADLATNGSVDPIQRSPLDSRWAELYLQKLTDVDRSDIPSAFALAERFELTEAGSRRNDYEFSVAVMLHLATSPQYRYTLDLNFEPRENMDPIEQFASVDRAGHCQFFASLLAMTLRARNIPSRLVVGYCTDEYSEISKRYIARGSHAHAWVEALIPRSAIPATANLSGQPPADSYWLRLDATPSSRLELIEGGGASRQAIDMARNLWDDYVVEMDRDRQLDSIAAEDNPMHRSYLGLVKRMALVVGRIRAGELGGGSLAGTQFSPLAALATCGITLLGLAAYRFRPARRKRRRRRQDGRDADEPKFDFYRDALQYLSSVGVNRERSQTPREIASSAVDAIGPVEGRSKRFDEADLLQISGSLDVLADWYYRLRFDRGHTDPSESNQSIDVALTRLRHTIEQSGGEPNAAPNKNQTADQD